MASIGMSKAKANFNKHIIICCGIIVLNKVQEKEEEEELYMILRKIIDPMIDGA